MRRPERQPIEHRINFDSAQYRSNVSTLLVEKCDLPRQAKISVHVCRFIVLSTQALLIAARNQCMVRNTVSDGEFLCIAVRRQTMLELGKVSETTRASSTPIGTDGGSSPPKIYRGA
jgi:hypothetical protein